MNEPNRPRSGDERLLRGRPADDAVRPGRSVFDDDLDDDYDEEEEFDDDYDDDDEDEEEDDDAVAMPHWTEPPTGQAPAPKGGDADAWTTLTGSQPRWRESAADYDDEPEVAATAAATEYDSEAAAEEFFEFDDEGDADFQRFIGDEPVIGADDDDDLASIPITNAGSTTAGRAGAGAAARTATKKAATKAGTRAEARPAARRRNDMRARVVTGVVLGALAIAAFMSGPAATVGLTSIVLGLCVIELSNALRRAGYQPATLLAIVAAVGAPIAVYQRGVDGLLVVIAVSAVFSLLWFLSKAGDESPVLNAGVTMLSVVYIGVLGSYGALMLRVFGHYGIGMILAAVLGTVAHDIGALLVGRSAGKTKLTSVSPGKTREGLIGGMLTSIIVVVVAVGMFKIAPFGQVPSDREGLWNGGMPQAVWLGLAIAVTAPLGDLVESLIKRDLGVKDMSNILKGHGGVLDRFDALLFTLPATYYMARFVIL
ncbi:MAG TPA: phosphatidate cytidylyltransferase [Acidimicrobiales bacterium]|nr:phosphatidate cytidylyltransferase [Acidimicrobiales bacterium]